MGLWPGSIIFRDAWIHRKIIECSKSEEVIDLASNFASVLLPSVAQIPHNVHSFSHYFSVYHSTAWCLLWYLLIKNELPRPVWKFHAWLCAMFLSWCCLLCVFWLFQALVKPLRKSSSTCLLYSWPIADDFDFLYRGPTVPDQFQATILSEDGQIRLIPLCGSYVSAALVIILIQSIQSHPCHLNFHLTD